MRWKRFALNLSLSDTKRNIMKHKEVLEGKQFRFEKGLLASWGTFRDLLNPRVGLVVFAFAQFMCSLYRTFTNVLRATHGRDITSNHTPRHLFAQKCFCYFFYDSKYIFMFFWSSTKKGRRVRWWTYCEADTWHFSQQPAYVYVYTRKLFILAANTSLLCNH